MSTTLSKIKVGTILSETQFYTVTSVNAKQNTIKVKTDNNLEFEIQGSSLIEVLNSADQFSETIKCSRTELAEIFKAHPRTAMTVNFNTKVNEKEVMDKIIAIYPNKGKMDSKANFEATVKAAVKEALEGEQRTMVGRHYSSTDDFGRVHFTDMNLTKDENKSYDTRTRLVDPRTINWIIVNGKKYIQK